MIVTQPCVECRYKDLRYSDEPCAHCYGGEFREKAVASTDDIDLLTQTTCPVEMLATTVKASNPKDAVGSRKVPLSTVSAPVLGELSLAMLEGALKYGRHNYRAIGVRASVYYDAAMRHLMAWWEGEDIDPDSGLSHLVKAMACMAVIRDAEIQNKMADDRPPVSPAGWVARLNATAAAMIDRCPEPKAPYTKEGM